MANRKKFSLGSFTLSLHQLNKYHQMKYLFFYIFMSVVFFCSCSQHKTTEISNESPIDTIPQMIMQIQRTSRLYTAECKVHKIITHDDQKKISGSFMSKDFSINLPLGNRKVAIPMNATIKAYIDFDNFSKENIRKKGDKINIILPDPKLVLTSSKINHREVKQYVAFTRSDFSDAELTSFEKQGRQAIINDIPHLGIINQAKESAARTLIPIIKQMGYTEENVIITFRKEFTISDLPTLLDYSTIEKINN